MVRPGVEGGEFFGRAEFFERVGSRVGELKWNAPKPVEKSAEKVEKLQRAASQIPDGEMMIRGAVELLRTEEPTPECEVK